MAYDENLADRIRQAIGHLDNVEEKEMMGGLTFMYNNKMCVGVIKDEMICRIDPKLNDEVLEKAGCRPMDFTGKPMKGWITIDEFGMKKDTDLNYWIQLAVDFNQNAKASKKKIPKKK